MRPLFLIVALLVILSATLSSVEAGPDDNARTAVAVALSMQPAAPACTCGAQCPAGRITHNQDETKFWCACGCGMPVKATKKACCSAQCTCGCNTGAECVCASSRTAVPVRTVPQFQPIRQYQPMQFRSGGGCSTGG